MTDADRLRELTESVSAMRDYAGSAAMKHVLRTLELLRDTYMHELVNIKPEDLQLKQGALRQVIGLHTALTVDYLDTPLV